MRLLNGLKTRFDPDRGASNMSRRTHEPFTWHSADPRSNGRRHLFVALLCVSCGSAGYLAGRSGVDPDRVPAKIRTTSQTTVAPANSKAVSEVPSKLDRAVTETGTTTDNRSTPLQTIASKTDVPHVVLLNPNSTSKAELSEHKSGPSAATTDSQQVNSPISAEPMRKKQKVFHSRRQDRSLAEEERALNDRAAPRRLPPRNALSTRHDDNAYRDYRDLREFILR